MRKKRWIRLLSLVTAIGLIVALPGVAWGQTDEGTTDRPAAGVDEVRSPEDAFHRVKARALEEIDKRLAAIGRWTVFVENNEQVSRDHQARLLADLSEAERGLTALRQDIEDAETLAELMELVPKIVTDYYVFALLGPKVHLVVGADTMLAVAERFEEVADHIQSAIDRAKEAGFDVSAAEEALAEMRDHVAAAEGLAEPVPNEVLKLQPKDMPGAVEDLRAAHGDLVQGREELRAAREKAREAIEALRDAIGGRAAA